MGFGIWVFIRSRVLRIWGLEFGTLGSFVLIIRHHTMYYVFLPPTRCSCSTHFLMHRAIISTVLRCHQSWFPEILQVPMDAPVLKQLPGGSKPSSPSHAGAPPSTPGRSLGREGAWWVEFTRGSGDNGKENGNYCSGFKVI